MRYVLLATAVAVSVLLAAPIAYAHVVVIGTSPSNGDRLSSAPDEIRIHYASEPKLQSGTGLIVGPNGGRWESGPARVEGDDLVIPMRSGTSSARYTVEFTAQSADQHPVAGTIGFEVIAAPQPQPSPAAEPAQNPEGTPLWLWAAAAAAVLVAVFAAGRRSVRRRTRRG